MGSFWVVAVGAADPSLAACSWAWSWLTGLRSVEIPRAPTPRDRLPEAPPFLSSQTPQGQTGSPGNSPCRHSDVRHCSSVWGMSGGCQSPQSCVSAKGSMRAVETFPQSPGPAAPSNCPHQDAAALPVRGRQPVPCQASAAEAGAGPGAGGQRAVPGRGGCPPLALVSMGERGGSLGCPHCQGDRSHSVLLGEQSFLL